MTSPQTTATLTCPICGQAEKYDMPTDACQHILECAACGKTIKPKKGECCVFCSYADRKCPPEQSLLDG